MSDFALHREGIILRKYLVKNKYTYEKKRQTCFDYTDEIFSESGNAVFGRYIYDVGEEIYSASVSASESVEITLLCEVAEKLSSASGICVKADGAGDGIVRVTFFDDDGHSFASACKINDAASGRGVSFYLSDMDFFPARMLIDSDGEDEVSVKVSLVNILNYLSEWGGQAHFYTAEGCKLADEGRFMKLSFDGEGSIESPVFPDSSATVYNMLMPRRNTIFFVLTNNSSAKYAKLYYTTYTHPEYSEDACVTLSLSSDAEPRAYYFNLSATKNCDGRLRSFKLVFEGCGDVVINRYSFEQEARLFDTKANIISCLANAQSKSVTVKGEIDRSVDILGATLCLFKTTMADEDEDAVGGKTLLSETDAEYDFEIDGIPLYDDKTSLLPYQLVCFLKKDGEYTRVSDRFYIENYEVFDSNPYPFELPDRCVSVLDFGAYGDAYHDDTEAIQRALDYVHKEGGGKVTVNGSSDRYGRRYIVTNLLIKSNTELCIEEGAILWQSHMRNDYPYAVTYGHDAVIPGINWTHNMHVSQLPLLQAAGSHHIKITGKGKLRAMDIGSEEGVDMKMRYSTGCEDRIHLIMVGFFDVDFVECRDFEIVRCNNYHSAFYKCQNVYCANLKYHEVKCLSGDGYGLIAGTNNVTVNRCFFQSNDDCIVLTSVYNDPRGLLWWTNAEGTHAGPYNITAIHSYLAAGTGKSIAFITWGTNDPIQERTEICGIRVHDCYIPAQNPIGTWCDNPYNGKVPFDNTETDDYSPVRDVRITGNRYEGHCTLGPIKPTDFISDCGLFSADNFVNGDFSLGGLANWTAIRNENPDSAHTVIYANKEKGCIEYFDCGRVSLCEGLHIKGGEYTLECEIMTGKSGCEIFVSDMISGEDAFVYHAERTVPEKIKVNFSLAYEGDYYIGIRNDSNDPDGFAIIDYCHII